MSLKKAPLASAANAAFAGKNPRASLDLYKQHMNQFRELDSADARIALDWISLCLEKFGDEDVVARAPELCRDMDTTLWPISEMAAQIAYRENPRGAFGRILKRNDFGGIAVGEIPPWSMGISAFLVDQCPLAADSMVYVSGAVNRDVELVFALGVDQHYLPFALKFLENLNNNRIGCFLLVHSVDKEITEQIGRIQSRNVTVLLDRTDLSEISERNKKGYFTFLRYRVAALARQQLPGVPLLIPDADAVFRSGVSFDPLIMSSADVGLLMVHRWPRPWQRFTAPLVFINASESATAYLRRVREVCLRTTGGLMAGENVGLWGVDQAALVIAHYEMPLVNYENIIRFLQKNMVLAQEFSKKTDILTYDLSA